MKKLAISGGRPVRKRLFPAYVTIGMEERKAADRVLRSGILSRFLGCWHKDFYGGPEVQSLEKEWAGYFKVKHAIAVNSCTSGLYCAAGAVGIEAGDEVIVAPYTMSASATAALIFHGIPIFADIEEDYYCLDPASVESRVTPRTKAIIAVDIFGLPYDAGAINRIARKNNLYVIEDAAQAPYAFFKGRFAGTLADIGVYSLNYHKHIHCGEGGIVVTDDDRLAERVRLIRNHAEAVVGDKRGVDLANMVGFNFRMTELEAAIARCQLRKLKKLVKGRLENCEYLARHLEKIPALIPPKVRPGSSHAYYLHPFKFKQDIALLSRDRFIKAICAELPATKLREAEGTLIGCGYVKPLYLEPAYQNQVFFGSRGYPFKSPLYRKKVNYKKGICPVTERMYESDLFVSSLIYPSLSKRDLDDIIEAFYKVWEYKKELT